MWIMAGSLLGHITCLFVGTEEQPVASSMLLYDRVIEYAWRMRRMNGSAGLCHRDASLLHQLGTAVVFELSSVFPLFTDWETEKLKPIPKRPPALPLWAEWKRSEKLASGGLANWTVGALIREASQGASDSVAWTGWEHDSDVASLFSAGRDRYWVKQFQRLDSVSGPWDDCLGTYDRGEVSVSLGTFLCSVCPDGSGFASALTTPVGWDRETFARSLEESTDPRVCEALLGLFSSFGLSVVVCPGYGNPDGNSVIVPWPPFMAFSMLNCRNVATETHTPDERTQRRASQAGCPPRTSFKTLHLQVPQETHSSNGSHGDPTGDNPGVRFHLCRGHFKHLRNARYKNPGLYWWPAHWRGSPDAGTVHKRYEVNS